MTTEIKEKVTIELIKVLDINLKRVHTYIRHKSGHYEFMACALMGLFKGGPNNEDFRTYIEQIKEWIHKNNERRGISVTIIERDNNTLLMEEFLINHADKILMP